MAVIDHLTKGGIPDGWTAANLSWLAKAHRYHAGNWQAACEDRAYWHARWAALIEDILESHYGNCHRI